jgi:hypothetical protein
VRERSARGWKEPHIVISCGKEITLTWKKYARLRICLSQMRREIFRSHDHEGT